MRILLVHNRYQQAGGEDSVFENEAELLRSAGHDVSTLTESNDAIEGMGAKLKAASQAVWSFHGQELMENAIRRERPDVVHVHNFFPRLSPAIFWTCRKHGIPTVLTLHNFRLTCANGLLFRDGKICEDCLGHSPAPAIRHRCYRGSRAGSAAVAAMIATHRHLGTWQHKVDRFIALTQFAKDIYVRAGIPGERISVKPNFVQDPPTPPLDASQREGFLYVGRLSSEKGVGTLIEAWRNLDERLTVAGDGPEASRLRAMASGNVVFAGHLDRQAVSELMARTKAVVVPSLWYETFGMTAAEALSFGTPVIASHIGGPATFIEDGMSGVLFETGSVRSLVSAIEAWPRDHQKQQALIDGARRAYQRQFRHEDSLQSLHLIYRQVRTESTRL